MSQKNVELVRRWIWAFQNDVELFRQTAHTDIEWFPFEGSHTPSYGVEGAMRVRDRWFETWEEHELEIEEVIDQGDSVFASVHITARGKASGVEVDVRLYMHCKVRDDKIVYLFEHEDRDDALEAVGLRE